MSGRLLAGRYRLDSVIGRGGTAAVWQGFDERLGRMVAVKLLADNATSADPVAAQRFDREARTVAGLAHPNIVAVYDAGTEAGQRYLVMELVDGYSLATLLRDGPLDIDQVLPIARQVCEALAAAHAAGVVHRDVKPANILLSRTGAVKVCDFGIAALQHAATSAASLTGPRSAVGTSDYMAPEQAAGDRVDGRADLYALGCVLYAMLTGAPPFAGDSPIAVASQHLHRPPAPVTVGRPDTPPALAVVVNRLLAKNPADRPEHAGEVAAQLAELAAHPATPATATVERAPTIGAARATATVVPPTRTIPVVDDYPPPAKQGLRLGPAGIAAVALGAAIVAALAVAWSLTAGTRPPGGEQAANPPATTQSAPVGTATASLDATTQINLVRTVIAAQTQAGQLKPNVANDLTRRLDEAARHLADGETDQAADKIAELRNRLTEQRNANKITEAGYQAILAAVDQLTAALPAADDHD
jgi:eukaryotic-like serine/threonine-protein kinase